MADGRLHVSIYTKADKVCLTIHDGHTTETHTYLTPDKAREIADTLRTAAMLASVGNENAS